MPRRSSIGGHLGNGKLTDSYVPVAVCAVGERAPCSSNLSEVTAIAAGEGFSVALLKNGTVVAWGENHYGQLGNGSTTFSDVPVAVCAVGEKAPCSHDLSEVSATAAGAGDSLALLKNGTVVAWGYNAAGQLGTGRTTGPEECSGRTACSKIPVPVSNLSEVSAIAAGAGYSMALLKNGTVKAWGENEGGQLGDGSTEPSDVPVVLSDLSEVSAISAGAGDSLALLKSGTVMSWGENNYGQLGDGSSSGPEECTDGACSRTPVPVSALSGVSSISAGEGSELAIGHL